MLSASIIYRDDTEEVAAWQAIEPHVDEVVAVKSTDAPGAHFEADCDCGCGSRAGDLKDFSAARNHAFSLCTGDSIVWLDTDDVIEGAAHLRMLAAANERVSFPYRFTRASTFYVPRIVRRGERWKYPIHNMLEHGMRGPVSDAVRWIHKRTDFSPSIARGLRLFRHWMTVVPIYEHDARMWGLWGRTLIDAGRAVEAIPKMEQALQEETSREARASLSLAMARSSLPAHYRIDWAWRAVRDAPGWPETWAALAAVTGGAESELFAKVARELPRPPTAFDIGR